MTLRHDVRRWAGVGSLVLGLLATGLTQSASAADPVLPPVTHDDRVSLWAGGVIEVDVLANDTDPQGVELAVCRLGKEKFRNLDLIELGDTVGVITSPRLKAGTYAVTYYACNFDHLTPGTLTITVKKPEPVTVTKVADRPGTLRFKNPNKQRVVVLWGSREERRPDGRIALAGHAAGMVTVERTDVFWIAFLPRVGATAGMGTVHGVVLPRVSADHGRAVVRALYQRFWDNHR